MTDINESAKREAFWLLCDNRIDHGMSRVVYTCTLNRDWVVKVETTAGQFQNVMEWEVWHRVKGTALEKWFAPCHHISSSGVVLIQSRTRQPRNSEYPDRMPIFFTDFKRSNYGLLGRRLVCHDYGTALITEHGLSHRLRKVEWWDR